MPAKLDRQPLPPIVEAPKPVAKRPPTTDPVPEEAPFAARTEPEITKPPADDGSGPTTTK